MSTMIIREMTQADLNAVTEIDRDSFSQPWPDNAFAAEIENKNARCLVAEENQIIFGYIVIWLVLDEAHIATIAIEKSKRGQGFSKRILKTALQSAYLEGSRFVYLEVRESNTVAIHLYTQLGFEIVGLRKAYYKNNNENAILMTLTNFEHINQ